MRYTILATILIVGEVCDPFKKEKEELQVSLPEVKIVSNWLNL